MPDGRCPSCGASVRAQADWCTLCYADLRPPPPAPPPPPPPAPAPVVAAPAPPSQPAPQSGPDPLFAPYDALLATQLQGTVLAPDPPAPEQVPTWPCLDCGAANPLEETACVTCGQPFGARFATKRDADARRQRMLKAIGAVVAFLALLALVTYLATPAPPPEDGEPVPIEVVR